MAQEEGGEVKKGLEKQRKEANMQGVFGQWPQKPLAWELPGCSPREHG